MSSLSEKIVELANSLGASGVPYAFGGAQALAYSVVEPRSTNDIDLNLFVGPEEAGPVLAALPGGIEVTDEARERIADDGQVRLRWGDTPVDLFFSTVDFHEAAARRVRQVPFDDLTIPVLSATDLTVCKALFARPKDWLDIEAMRDAGSIDGEEALYWVERLLGSDDHSYRRLEELLAAEPEAPTGQDELPPPLRR